MSDDTMSWDGNGYASHGDLIGTGTVEPNVIFLESTSRGVSGFKGIKFNKATVSASRYVPGGREIVSWPRWWSEPPLVILPHQPEYRVDMPYSVHAVRIRRVEDETFTFANREWWQSPAQSSYGGIAIPTPSTYADSAEYCNDEWYAPLAGQLVHTHFAFRQRYYEVLAALAVPAKGETVFWLNQPLDAVGESREAPHWSWQAWRCSDARERARAGVYEKIRDRFEKAAGTGPYRQSSLTRIESATYRALSPLVTQCPQQIADPFHPTPGRVHRTLDSPPAGRHEPFEDVWWPVGSGGAVARPYGREVDFSPFPSRGPVAFARQFQLDVPRRRIHHQGISGITS